MGKLRKFTTRLLSITLAAVMSLSLGITASAKPTYQWGVDFSADNPEDCYGWIGDGNTKFYTDDTVHTPGSKYSILLETTYYDTACVEKTYKVEPYTTYKFSAMVKYSGYQRFHYNTEESGACIGEAYYYDPYNDVYKIPYGRSDFTVSPEWTRLEYEFTTGNETTHGLRLQNGDCMGKAWFSDIKLEKAQMTNNWNILAVFFRNVNANVVLDGKRVNFKNSLTENNIYEMNEFALDTLPANLKALSNGRMTVNSIDRYYSDEVITEKDLTPYYDNENNISGFCVDEKISPALSKVIDKYLTQKKYHQIIIFVPFVKADGISLSDGWWGLGGTSYKNVHFAQITNSWDGAFEIGDKFLGHVPVHEMCHGLEAASKKINPSKTPNFHSTLYDYPDSNVSSYERVHMFMTATLPGGKGLDTSVFNVPTGKYVLSSNDMATGKGIMPLSSSTTPPAPKNFKAKPYLYENISISWDSVPNASGYQFASFTNGSFNKIRKTLDCSSNSTGVTVGPISKNQQYYYGVRTVYTINGTDYYSDWTTLTYPSIEEKVVPGDVDNNGAFNAMDVAAAVSYFFSGEKIDKRTADAIGIAGRYQINALDVALLVDRFMNR